MLQAFDLNKLTQLVSENTPEDRYLEFKDYVCSCGKMEPKHRDDLVKEIVAMANADGGHIVIGISEGIGRNATSLKGIGCSSTYLDRIQLAIQQSLLSKVHPRVHSARYYSVPLDLDNSIVVVEIERSPSRPHALNTGSMDIFPIRHTNGVTYMSIDELRQQFMSINVNHVIRGFISERLELIRNCKIVPGNYVNGIKLVMHVIPEWGLYPGNMLDISAISDRDIPKHLVPLNEYNLKPRYNADGFMVIRYYSDEFHPSYVQTFRNASIELVEPRLMNIKYDDKDIVEDTERRLHKRILDIFSYYDEQQIPPPYHVYITLLDAAGFKTYCVWGTTQEITRDIVYTQPAYCPDDNYAQSLKPLFDSFSNAFGIRKASILL